MTDLFAYVRHVNPASIARIIGFALIIAAAYLALAFLADSDLLMPAGARQWLFGAAQFSRVFWLCVLLAAPGVWILHKANSALVEMAARAIRARDRGKLEWIVHAIPARLHSRLLPIAAGCGDHDLVKRLIVEGAAINSREAGGTALWKAAAAGHAEVVKTLIANGADVNEGSDEDLSYPLGQSPLAAAIRCGYREVATLLIEGGADLGDDPQMSAEEDADLDALILASVRRFREAGDLDRALELYERVFDDRWDRRYGDEPILISRRDYAEAYEAAGNWQRALDLFCNALTAWKRRWATSSSPTTMEPLFPREPVESFSESALDELVNAPSADRKEIGALLRGCERVLEELGRGPEQERVAAALQKLGGPR